MENIAAGLQELVTDQINARQATENRWLDNVRAYQGRYNTETESKINASDGSKLFVGITRSKVDIATARMGNIAFPSSDRAWGIKATAIPDIWNKDKTAQLLSADGSGVTDNGEPVTREQYIKQLREIADQRAALMQDEMDDQLQECKFQEICMSVIHDAALFGTGIIKGPFVKKTTKKESIHEAYGKTIIRPNSDIIRPVFARVDPFTFYPNMNCVNWDDNDFVFIQHVLTRQQVIRLIEQPGFNKKIIKKILDTTSFQDPEPTWLQSRRDISMNMSNKSVTYTIWEYHGPIDDETMTDEQHVVWFCNDEVIKKGPEILDNGKLPFTIFNWEHDFGSLFGIGIASLMNGSQASINAAYRMMLDNASLSVGPQIVIDKSAIKPVDNNWALKPRKIWIKSDGASPVSAAFQTFHIESRQPELINLFQLAMQLADLETGQPAIAQGDIPPNIQRNAGTSTAAGLQQLQGAADVSQRRNVRNWDVALTQVISNLYQWNMQFNDNDELKGDCDIEALGTTIISTRNMQAQALMMVAVQIATHPIFGKYIRPYDLVIKLIQSQGISTEQIVLSRQEVISMEQKEAEQPPVQQELPSVLAKVELDRKQFELNSFVAKSELELEQKRLELESQIGMKKLEASTMVSGATIASKQQIQEREISLKERIGSGI